MSSILVIANESEKSITNENTITIIMQQCGCQSLARILNERTKR